MSSPSFSAKSVALVKKKNSKKTDVSVLHGTLWASLPVFHTAVC